MQGVLGIFRVAMGAGVVLLQSCVHSGFPRIGQGQRDHPPHTHTHSTSGGPSCAGDSAEYWGTPCSGAVQVLAILQGQSRPNPSPPSLGAPLVLERRSLGPV